MSIFLRSVTLKHPVCNVTFFAIAETQIPRDLTLRHIVYGTFYFPSLTMPKKKPERYLKGSFTGLNIM